MNLENIIEREQIQRKDWTDKLKEEIQANMKPFSFYSEDKENKIQLIKFHKHLNFQNSKQILFNGKAKLICMMN